MLFQPRGYRGKVHPPKAKDVVAREFARDFVTSTRRRRALVDMNVVSEHAKLDQEDLWSLFAPELAAASIEAVPVVRVPRKPYSNALVKEIAEAPGCGLCLRLKPIDLAYGGLEQSIEEVLRFTGVSPAEVDLVFDFECFCDGDASYERMCEAVPHLSDWRSFTLISGDFPRDLSEYSPGDHHRRRRDWGAWLAAVRNGALPRVPAFGDYTIQYGVYTPPVSSPNYSASVRYTLENDWLILRGEWVGKPNGPGTAQWNAWAMLLCDSDDFYGAEYSAGDAYVHERSRTHEKSGNPEKWLYAGINHHLTVVARQIASLSGS